MCNCRGRNLRLTEWVQCLMIAGRFIFCLRSLDTVLSAKEVMFSSAVSQNRILLVYLNAVLFKPVHIVGCKKMVKTAQTWFYHTHTQKNQTPQHEGQFKNALQLYITPLRHLLYVTKRGFVRCVKRPSFHTQFWTVLSAQIAHSIFVHVSAWKYVWKNNPRFVLVSLLDVNRVSQNLK